MFWQKQNSNIWIYKSGYDTISGFKVKKGELMTRIIAVSNQKGGVGKTTTAVNLSAALAEMGSKVLLIDMDPQGNATSGVGINKNDPENTMYELILGDAEYEDVLIKTEYDNLWLMPSDINLSGVEIELLEVDRREYRLKDVLEPHKQDFDYILIDCPPSLNMLTVNAMTAADTVLVPIQCEYYALEGLSQLLQTIILVRKKLNPYLELEGLVFTMYDARTNLSVQVVENVKNNIKQNIYDTIIPRNVRLAEAPSHGMPITKYAPSSTGADSYRLLALEVRERGKNKK